MPVGAAVSQSPPGGSRAEEGSVVTVYYSLGPQSAAKVSVTPSDTDDGLSDSERDSTGSGTDPVIMNCTRSYRERQCVVIRRRHLRAAFPGRRRSASHEHRRLGHRTRSSRRAASTWSSSGRPAPASARPASAPCASLRSARRCCRCPISNEGFGLDPLLRQAHLRAEQELDCARTRTGSSSPSTGRRAPTASTRTECSPARLQRADRLDMGLVEHPVPTRDDASRSSRSSRDGCVRVTQKSGSRTVYSRDFDATTGLYLR